jgi:hypothetical protein
MDTGTDTAFERWDGISSLGACRGQRGLSEYESEPPFCETRYKFDMNRLSFHPDNASKIVILGLKLVYKFLMCIINHFLERREKSALSDVSADNERTKSIIQQSKAESLLSVFFAA